MVQLVTGALVMGYVVIGLFFLRFWKQSHDRLFGFFAAAFFVLAGQRLALAFTTETDENTVYLYLIRLLAFGLILFGILDKNRAVKSSKT